jgi:hypothetical protein
MNSIYTKICVATIIFFCNAISAQDFQGIAIYQSKTTIDLDEFGSRQMSEEKKNKLLSE